MTLRHSLTVGALILTALSPCAHASDAKSSTNTCQAPDGGTRLAQTLRLASKDKNWFPWMKDAKAASSADWSSLQVHHQLVGDQLLVDDPQLSAYLDRLAARLLQSWGTAASGVPVVAVFVRDSDEACAYSERSSVTLCTGMLRKLKSEEAVAAVMAHELAHILMKQNEPASKALTLDMVMEAAGLLATYKEVSKEPEGTYAGSRPLVPFGATQVGSVIWADLLHPMHSRENERAADELGTDLMRGAGFDPAPGFDEVFPVLKEDVASRSERMKILQALILARLTAAAERRVYNQRSLVDQVVNSAQEVIFRELDELGKSYDTTQLRSDSRGEYERATADCVLQPAPDSSAGNSDEFQVLFGSGGHVNQLLELDAVVGRLSATAWPSPTSTPPAIATTDAAPPNAIAPKGSTNMGAPLGAPTGTTHAAPARKKGATQSQRNPAPATPQPTAEQDYQQLLANMGRLQPRGLLVASRYALMKTDTDTAIRLLMRATTLRYATPSAYIALADLQSLQLHQPDIGIQTLLEGQKKFNAWRPFLPDLTGTEKLAQDVASAERYASVCECQGIRQRNENLGAGAFFDLLKDQREVTGLYAECMSRLGYDVRSPEVRKRIYHYGSNGRVLPMKEFNQQMAWRRSICLANE